MFFENQIPIDNIADAAMTARNDAMLKDINQRIQAEALAPDDTTEQDNAKTVDWLVPPGLVGDMACFFYNSAIKPVKEVALAAAIGYSAALFGRAFNISRTGLNIYIAIIAKSGRGKEIAISGPSLLNKHVSQTVPSAYGCISPYFSSPQAIHRHLSEQSQCFVWPIREIGIFTQRICSKHASANDMGFKQFLLSAYNTSGNTDILQGSTFADKAKNFLDIERPCVSIIGDSTPESYYRGFDESNIEDGYASRFTVIEYNGIRVPDNANPISVPDPAFLTRLCDAVAEAKKIESLPTNNVVNVELNEDAKRYAADYSKHCDDHINNNPDKVACELYNRAHIKLLKLSALLAVGINPYQPVVTLAELKWARTLIDHSIAAVVDRFEAGQVGTQTSAAIEQRSLMAKCLRDFWRQPYSKKIENAGINKDLHAHKIINNRYLQMSTANYACFRNDRNPLYAYKQMVQQFMDNGHLERIELKGIKGAFYRIVELKGLPK